MNLAKSEISTSEALRAIESNLNDMTVSEIAIKTGKSERAVKTYLTRHGIVAKDYDGSKKAVKLRETSIQPAEAVEPNPSNPYQAMASVERDSNRRWTILGWLFAFTWIGMTYWGFSTFGGGFFIFWILISIAFPVAYMMTAGSADDAARHKKLDSLSVADKESYIQTEQRISEVRSAIMNDHLHNLQFGALNLNLVCPHCQTKGQVRSKSAEEVTSTKIVPVVGNTIKARKRVTQMHCDHCGTTWNI